jgi:hypothetical protein
VTETTARCAAAGTIGCGAKKLAVLSANFSAIEVISQKVDRTSSL